ncbi:TIGR03086 family metal-binding protein [Pseudonocardia sp. TRM90224]|uniref:TIGR03086 family metal-binding protein n=1 Tax=Pseudonocardia sp. TRM90224 TaxID=2812678 RepID=UPI001E648E02|nr:TIGR03086 family metal-binding protein [Pseudonocardia sp. TRM90224]
MHTDLRPLHRRALDDTTGLIARIGPDDLTRPSPCVGWDLRALLGHMVGQNHGFAAAVEDGDAPRSAYAERPPEPDAVEADWKESADRLATAFAAADLDTPVRMAEMSDDMRFPAGLVLSFHLLDSTVHAWDVATTLGIAYTPDDELVAATLKIARGIPGGPVRETVDAPFGPILPYSGTDDWRIALALVGRKV